MLPFPEADSELDVPPVVVPVAGAVVTVAALAGQKPDKEKCEEMFWVSHNITQNTHLLQSSRLLHHLNCVVTFHL